MLKITAIEVVVEIDDLDTSNYLEAGSVDLQLTFRNRKDKLIYATEQKQYLINHEDNRIQKQKESFIIPGTITDEECDPFKSALFQDTYVYLTARLLMRTDQGFRTIIICDYLIFQSRKFERELVQTQTQDFPYFKGNIYLESQKIERNYFMFKKQMAFRIALYKFSGFYLMLSSDNPETGSTYIYSSTQQFPYIIMEPSQLYLPMVREDEKILLSFYGACDELPNHQFLLYTFNIQKDTEGVYLVQPFKINGNFNQLLTYYLDKFEILTNNQEDSPLKQKLYNLRNFYSFQFNNMFKSDPMFVELDLGAREKEMKYLKEFDFLAEEMARLSKEKTAVDKTLIQIADSIDMSKFVRIPVSSFKTNKSPMQSRSQSRNKSQEISVRSAPVVDDLLEKKMEIYKKQCEVHEFLKEDKFLSEVQTDFVDFISTTRAQLYGIQKDMVQSNELMHAAFQCLSNCYGIAFFPLENEIIKINGDVPEYIDKKFNIDLTNNTKQLVSSAFIPQTDILICLCTEKTFSCYILDSSMKDKEQITVNLNDYNSPRIFKYLRYKNVSDIFIIDKIGDLSTGNVNYFKSEADTQQCCELPDYVFDYTLSQLLLSGNSLEAILADFQISNRQLFAYQLYCEICQRRTQQSFYQMNLPVFCTNQLVPESLLQIDQISMKQSIYLFLFQIKQYLDFKRYYENKFVVSISSDNAKKLNFVMNEFFKFDCKCDYLKILEFDNFAENTFTVKQFNEIFLKLSQDNFKYAFEQDLQFEPEQDQNIQLIINKLKDSSTNQFTINQIVQFLVYLFEKFGNIIKSLEFKDIFTICLDDQDSNQLQIEVTYADDSKLISNFREQKAVLFRHNCIGSYQIQSLLLKVGKTSYKLFQNGYFLNRYQYLFAENKQFKYCLKQQELEQEVHYLFYISAQSSSPRLFYKSDDYEMWGESIVLTQSICGLRFAFHKLSYPKASNMTVDICIDQNKKIQVNPSNDGLMLGIPSIVVISQNEPKASEIVLLEDGQKQQFTETFGIQPFECTKQFSFDQNHIINQTDSAINEQTIAQLVSYYQFAKNQSKQVCIIMYRNRDNIYSVSNQSLVDQKTQIESNSQQQLDVFSYLNGLPQIFTFDNVDLQMQYFLSLFNTQDGSIQNEQFSFSEFNVCFGTQDCFLAEIIKGHPCVIVDVSGCLKTTYYCEMKISKKVNSLLDQFFEIQTDTVITDSQDYEKYLIEKLGQEKIDIITKAIVDNQKLFFEDNFQQFLEGRLISLKQSKQKEFLKFVLLSLNESQLTSNQLVQSVIFCCQSYIILNFTEMLKSRRFIKATPEDMKSIKVLFCQKLKFKINDDAFLSPQTLDDYFMNNLDILEESEHILDCLLQSDKPFVDDLFDYQIIEFEKTISLSPNSLEFSLKQNSSRNESENFQLLLGWLIAIDKQVKIMKQRKFVKFPEETLPIITEYLSKISENKFNVASFSGIKEFRQLEDYLRNDDNLNINIIIEKLFDKQVSLFQHVIPNFKLSLQLLLQQSQYCSNFTDIEVLSFLDQTQQNINILYQLSFSSIFLLQEYSDHLNNRQGFLLEEQQVIFIVGAISKQNKVNTQLTVVYNSVELEDQMFAYFSIQLLYQIWQNLYNETECYRITQTRVYNTQLLFKDIPLLDIKDDQLLIQQYHILTQTIFRMLLIIWKFQNQVKNRLVFDIVEPQSIEILSQLAQTINPTIMFPVQEQNQQITSYILELEYLFLNNFEPFQLLEYVQLMLDDVQTNQYLNKLFQTNFFHPFRFIQKQLESLDQKFQQLFTLIQQKELTNITMNQVVQSVLVIHSLLFKKQLQLQSRISITVQSQYFQLLTNTINQLFKLSVQSLDIAEFEDNCELLIDKKSICTEINKLYKIENLQQLSTEMIYSPNDCYILTENQDIQRVLFDKFNDPKKKLLMNFNELFQLLCEIIYSALLFQQLQQNRKFIPLSYFDMTTMPLYFKNMGVDINYLDGKDEKWLEDTIARQKRGAAMNQVMQSLLMADVKQLLAIMKVKIQNSTSLIDEKFKTLQEPWLSDFIKDGVFKARKKEMLNSNQCIQVVLFLVDAYHDHVLYLQNRLHINLNVNDSTVVATLISKLPDIHLSSISNIFKTLDIEDQIYDQNQFDQVIPLCLKYLKDFRNLLILFDEKIRDPNAYFISILQDHVDDKEKAFLRQVRSCIELNKQVTQNQVVQYLIYVIYVLKQKDIDLQQRYFIKVPDTEWEDLIFIIDEKYPFRLSKIAKLDTKELENQMTHQVFGQELKDTIINLIEPMSEGQQAIFDFKTSRLQEFFSNWILSQIEGTRLKLGNTFNKLLSKDIQIFTDNDLCQVFLAAVLSMNVIGRYRQQRQFINISEQQFCIAITLLEKNAVLQQNSTIINILQLEDYVFDQQLDGKCQFLLNSILSASPQQLQVYFGEEIHYQKEYIQDLLKHDQETNKIVHILMTNTSTVNDITQTLLYVLVSLYEYSLSLSNRVYAKQFSPYAVSQLSRLLNLPSDKFQNYSNPSEVAKCFDNAVIECRQQKNVSIIVSDIVKTGYFDHFQYYFVKQIIFNSQPDMDVEDFNFVISVLQQQTTINDNQKNQFLLLIATHLLNIRIKIENSRIIPIPEESISQLMQLHYSDWQFDDALRKFTKCVYINQVFLEFFKKEQLIKYLDITTCNYEDDFDIQMYFTKIQSIELSTFLRRTYDLYKQKNYQDLTENSVLQLANFITYTFMTKQVLQLDHTAYTNEIQVVLFIISGDFNFITKSLKQNEILQKLKELEKESLVKYVQFFIDTHKVSNLFSRDIQSSHEQILLECAQQLPERNYLQKLISKVFHQQLQKVSLIQKVDFIFFTIGVLSQKIMNINTTLQYSQTEIMQIMRHLTIRMQVDVYANCCPENIQQLLKFIIFNDIKGRNLTLVNCYNIIAKSEIVAEREGVEPFIQKILQKQLLTLEEATKVILNIAFVQLTTKPKEKIDLRFTQQQLLLVKQWIDIFGFNMDRVTNGNNCVQLLVDDQVIYDKMAQPLLQNKDIYIGNVFVTAEQIRNCFISPFVCSRGPASMFVQNNQSTFLKNEIDRYSGAIVIAAFYARLKIQFLRIPFSFKEVNLVQQYFERQQIYWPEVIIDVEGLEDLLDKKFPSSQLDSLIKEMLGGNHFLGYHDNMNDFIDKIIKKEFGELAGMFDELLQQFRQGKLSDRRRSVVLCVLVMKVLINHCPQGNFIQPILPRITKTDEAQMI